MKALMATSRATKMPPLGCTAAAATAYMGRLIFISALIV
jgi:hypothetical protein